MTPTYQAPEREGGSAGNLLRYYLLCEECGRNSVGPAAHQTCPQCGAAAFHWRAGEKIPPAARAALSRMVASLRRGS